MPFQVGRVVEMGTHDELRAVPQGLYAHLWAMQEGVASTVTAPPPKDRQP